MKLLPCWLCRLTPHMSLPAGECHFPTPMESLTDPDLVVQTTLMDVLAGRKTGGEIEGDIMVNVRTLVSESSNVTLAAQACFRPFMSSNAMLAFHWGLRQQSGQKRSIYNSNTVQT